MLELDPMEWASIGGRLLSLEPPYAFEEDFLEYSPFSGNPNTFIRGAYRPIFLWRKEFELWLRKTFGQTRAGGRKLGSGSYLDQDMPYLKKMHEMRKAGEAKSDYEAARKVASDVPRRNAQRVIHNQASTRALSPRFRFGAKLVLLRTSLIKSDDNTPFPEIRLVSSGSTRPIRCASAYDFVILSPVECSRKLCHLAAQPRTICRDLWGAADNDTRQPSSARADQLRHAASAHRGGRCRLPRRSMTASGLRTRHSSLIRSMFASA